MSDIFIGRRREQYILNSDIFTLAASEYCTCYALNGPNNIGKTELIYQLGRQLERSPIPNVYYFYMEFIVYQNPTETYWGFWKTLIGKFSQVINRRAMEQAPNPDADVIDEILEIYEVMKTRSFDVMADNVGVTCLDIIFRYYKQLGIRLIIAIDEFDRAKNAFDDGTFFMKLFSLSNVKSGDKLLLSIILISRRHPANIAHHMNSGSDFSSAYPSLVLRGFNQRELNEYFDTYKELPCGVPDEQTRKEILYICGRNPGLLMTMRKRIMETLYVEDTTEYNVGEIYRRCRSDFQNTFDRMWTLMGDEKTVSGCTCRETFIEQFVGPVCTEPQLHKDNVDRMYDLGFVTMAEGKESIYYLSGMEDQEAAEEAGEVVEPLSPYFVDYVIRNKLPFERNRIADKLAQAELMLRDAIHHAGKAKYGEGWETQLQAMFPHKEQFVSRLRMEIIENGAAVRGYEGSRIYVLSFREYMSVCKANPAEMWSLLAPLGCIGAGTERENIENGIELLYRSRNLSAHKSFEVMNAQRLALLDQYSTALIQSLATVNTRAELLKPAVEAPQGAATAARPAAVQPLVQPAAGPALVQPAAAAPVPKPAAELVEPSVSERMRLIGETVRMDKAEVGNTGNLRGLVEGTVFKLSVPGACFGLGEASAAAANPEAQYRILRYDENAKAFIADRAEHPTLPGWEYLKQTVLMTNLSVGNNGSLQGEIGVTGVKAVVTKRKLVEKGIAAAALAQSGTVKVLLIGADNKGYAAELV